MINYPNGGKINKGNSEDFQNHKNLGMTLEKDVSTSCDYFIDRGIAVFYKRPTPIHVYNVAPDNHFHITEAYFETKSTTDYNGLYRGKYIDFECKETRTKSFLMDRVKEHQIKHLLRVKELGGIGFYLIRFSGYDETYILDASYIGERFLARSRAGFSRDFIKMHGTLVTSAYSPRLNLIKALDEAYFSEEDNQAKIS